MNTELFNGIVVNVMIMILGGLVGNLIYSFLRLVDAKTKKADMETRAIADTHNLVNPPKSGRLFFD